MRQPTWKLLVYACIIAFLFGYLMGKTTAQNKAMEQIEKMQELRRASDLVAQKAVLMGNRAGEELKKAMISLDQMFSWNESIIVE